MKRGIISMRAFNRFLLAGTSHLAILVMSAGGAWADTAIPSTSSGYTIPSDGDYSIASGVSVRNASDDVIAVPSGRTVTLTNNGTIDGDYYRSLHNAGTISLLNNSGIIKNTNGSWFNIRNDGTIYLFKNTGSISGPLSGFSNLWLVDNLINLGSISSISNSGTINTLTNAQSGLPYSGPLPGAYNTYFKTPSSFGTVVFSGISGGTALTYGLVKANGVSYAVGTYANAIASSSALTFTYATVNGVTYALSLDASCAASTYCYDLTISAVSNGGASSNWSSIGQQAGGNGAVIGRALDQIAAQNGLSSQLSSLSALAASEQHRALAQMGATSLSAVVVASGTTMSPSNAAIGNHLGAILAQSAPRRGTVTGLSTGEDFRKGAIWGEVLGNHSSLASSSTGAGFNSTAYGLLVGADTYVSDNIVAGFGLNWLRNSARGATTASGNSSVTDTYQVNLYGSWRPSGDALWLQGLAAVGLNQYDQKRGISFLGETARAKYQGLQLQTKLTAGYDVPIDDSTILTPMGSLRVARMQNRAYTETGSTVNQHVERQEFISVESILGTKLARNFDTGWGRLAIDAQVGWVHDYVNSPITTVANLSGVSYVLDTARLPADGVQLAFGGTLQQSDDLSLRLEYQGDVRPGYTSHTGLLKVRQSF
jgi:uncharacterized protein with beta-barrel porin domain